MGSTLLRCTGKRKVTAAGAPASITAAWPAKPPQQTGSIKWIQCSIVQILALGASCSFKLPLPHPAKNTCSSRTTCGHQR